MRSHHHLLHSDDHLRQFTGAVHSGRAATFVCDASVCHESAERLSRQRDDFHRVRLTFWPLLAFEARLGQGSRSGIR